MTPSSTDSLPAGPVRRGADGQPLPRLGEPSFALLALMVVALCLLGWRRLDGYQLADSIEYMEHAQAFARGEEVLDSQNIRPPAFPALLTPFFLLGDLFGLDDYKPVVALIRLLQLTLSMLLLRQAARLGAILAGRRAGWWSGFFVGTCPVFLQYAVSPVSGMAAALCIGLAAENALLARSFEDERPGAGSRLGLRAGIWVGLATMTKFHALPIGGLLLLLTAARDLRRPRITISALLGLAAIVIVHMIGDALRYGSVIDGSLANWFLENFASLGGRVLYNLGFHDLARQLYEAGAGSLGSGEKPTLEDVRQLNPVTWYLTELPTMLAWPVIAILAVGLARYLRAMVKERSLEWPITICALTLVGNVAVMSMKGSMDFRLWLPLLPFLAPLCALGMEPFLRRDGARPLLRSSVVALIAIGTVTLGWNTLAQRNPRKFSGFWAAMRIVDARAAELRAQASAESGEQAPKIKATCAYHWAVFLREGPDVELVKLPHHLPEWMTYGPPAKELTLQRLEEMDFFITHLPVLTTNPSLMAAVNEAFQVEALLWDHTDYEEIGPVFVLRRRTGDQEAPTFFEVIEDVDPEDYRREHLLGQETHFVRWFEGWQHLERIQLLGWEYRSLEGDGHGWITYHWHCASEIKADYTLVDRITTVDERYAWQNNHAPLYGLHRTDTWRPGTVYRESWPLVAAQDPYDSTQRYRPLGGPYRRGDLMLAFLWMSLVTFDEHGEITGRMEAARPGEDRPMRRDGLEDERLVEGVHFSKDGMVRSGHFFLPVHASAHVPDDGRPIPD